MTPERFHPYVAVDRRADLPRLATDPSIRRFLRDRAIEVATRLERRARSGYSSSQDDEWTWDPLLVSADRATDGLASRRVANMFRAFREFVDRPDFFGASGDFHDAAENLFDPLPASADPDRYLTSPALLVLLAVQYGHVAWHRQRHHEAHSAYLAYSALGDLELPLEPLHRHFVAALIAHQTLLRVGWQLAGHHREVWGYTMQGESLHSAPEDNEQESDRLLAEGIARTLFPFLGARAGDPELRQQLSAALVLTSLCLQCRHLLQADPRLTGISGRIMQFSRRLPETGPTPRTALAFFQYGRYVRRHDAKSWAEFRRQVEDRIKKIADSEGRPFNLTVCFDPNAKRVGELQSEDGCIAIAREESDENAGELVEAIQETVGWTVEVDSPETRILRELSIEHGDEKRRDRLRELLVQWPGQPEKFFPIYRHLERAILAGEREPLDKGYYPVPLVGRLLTVLNRACPLRFTVLRLRPRNLPPPVAAQPQLNRPFTVFLPRLSAKHVAGKEDIEICWLVSRYVAAMVINLEVSLGPQRVDLDYFSEQAETFWDLWIARALEHKAHHAILSYLEIWHSAPCSAGPVEIIPSVRPSPEVGSAAEIEGRKAIGIDIGATEIKCGLFGVEVSDTAAGGSRPRVGAQIATSQFPTQPPGGSYADARDFADYVLKRLENQPDVSWFESLLAVGIGWPGAVHDDGSIGGPSGLIKKFSGFENWPGQPVSAQELRRLNVLEAFESKLARRVEKVVVLNDGDADVKSREEPRDLMGLSDSVALVLKAGTGTACGVYAGSQPVPLLAEAGKIVLDLEKGTLPEQPAAKVIVSPGKYPKGLLNDYCSAKTLPRYVAAKLKLSDAQVENLKLEAHEVGYFLATRDQRESWEVFKRIKQERIRKLTDEGVPTVVKDCARIAGCRLGDAIAMLVTVFRCSEVRLAGGPLSGETGRLLAAQARTRLREVYGFDVVDRIPGEMEVLDAHALSEIRKIRVLLPKSSSGGKQAPQAGALGAARAALEEAIRVRKGRALRWIRSKIHDMPFAEKETEIDPEALVREKPELLISEIESLIGTFMATLGVTRSPDGRYFKISREGQRDERPAGDAVG